MYKLILEPMHHLLRISNPKNNVNNEHAEVAI